MLVVLLNTDAFRSIACDLLPADDVVVPTAVRVNRPRIVPWPTTSRAVAGVFVLMPILAFGDVPDWNTAELPIVAAPVKSGRKPAVPAPVIMLAAGVTLVVATVQDAWANAHRIPVELAKPDKEWGFYLHPELLVPQRRSLSWRCAIRTL